MSQRFPNVYLTRSYKIPIRSYTTNIFVRQNFYCARFYKAETFYLERSDKYELLSYKILSDLIKIFYRLRPDELSYEVTHNLIRNYRTIL